MKNRHLEEDDSADENDGKFDSLLRIDSGILLF